MRHKVFGSLTYDAEDLSWTGKRRFPEFIPCRQTPHGKGKAPTTFDLYVQSEEAEEPPEPSPAQVRAFEFFVDHEESICRKVIDAVFRWYCRRRTQDRKWFEDEECPEIHASDELRDLMEFHSLRVRNDRYRGTALVGFSFGCKWDDEHGLGVLVHRQTIVDVGGADIAFSQADVTGPVWMKVCTVREKKAARTIVQTLRALYPESGESAEAEGSVASLGPYQNAEKLHRHLVAAIFRGIAREIRPLIAQGADINFLSPGGIHPLFPAIQEGNVFAVKTMLELGINLRAQFFGKTPLQKALSMVELYSPRPGGTVVAPLKDRLDRATVVLRMLREAGAE
jgi:Domain of unknown function (DUF6985)